MRWEDAPVGVWVRSVNRADRGHMAKKLGPVWAVNGYGLHFRYGARVNSGWRVQALTADEIAAYVPDGRTLAYQTRFLPLDFRG